LGRRQPHPPEIEKTTNSGPENMYNAVAGVEQPPAALPHAFDANTGPPRLFNIFDQVIGNSTDMTLRSAAGHDHVICDRGFSGEIDDDVVVSFHVFKTCEDSAERFLGARM